MTDKPVFYVAPMEGLTGYAWRKAHDEVFGGADKYYTPFIVANQTHFFKTREIRDLSNNEPKLIPQLLTDKAEHFIWGAEELKNMGFDEINFNLGCPSKTVVPKGKGSAILRDPDHLDRMLDEIFSSRIASELKISVKTRIGFEYRSEWEKILEVYNRYPISELIIHARTREEFYNGQADRDTFMDTMEWSSHKLVYNGDVYLPDDEAFTNGWNVMAGRGLLRDPALFRKAKGGPDATVKELQKYHELLLGYYGEYMQGDQPVIKHVKSMWVYFAELFDYDEKTLKELKKARHMNEYMAAANEILTGPRR